MSIRHHPRDETLMAYAAGALVPALSVLVACHLARCARCRAELARMEAIGGALLAGLPGFGPPTRAVERALAVSRDGGRGADGAREGGGLVAGGMRMAEGQGGGDAVLPAPLRRQIGAGIEMIPWRTLAPGVEQFRVPLPRRGGDLRLLRVQPGLKLLRHGHYGAELTMVLRGAYADETGEYGAGDVADLDEDIEHRPRALGDEACLCIVAGETHPRYKSWKIRLLRPFLGL